MTTPTIPTLEEMSPGTLPEIIGRERERARLLEAAGRLADGEGCVVHLVGERGLGKSLLKDSLIAELRRREVTVLELRSTPSGPPLGVLAAVLETAVDQLGLAELSATLAWTESQREQVAQFLSADDDEGMHREALRSALTELLLVGDEPRAIVFEDFEHAGPLVREVVEHAAQEVRRRGAMFVVVERPGRQRASRRPGWHVLRLQPLTADASTELVQARLDVRQLPAATVRQLVDKVAGNPYFLDQILEAWVEDGVLEPSGGGFRVCRTDKALRLPESLDMALEERIERLPERERQLLRMLAVAGSTSSGALTAAASELFESDTSGIRNTLQSLGAQKLVERVAGSIEVAETALADVAARGLEPERRARTHAAVARALEANGSTHAERLAHHWQEAGVPERALPYLVTAAAEHRRVFDHDGAEALYRRAIDIVRSGSSGDLELHPELWEQLGDVYLNRGDYRAAAEAYEAAEEQSAEHTDPGAATTARRMRKAAAVALHLGNQRRALSLCAMARRHCGKRHRAEEAWVAAVEAASHIRQSQLDAARSALIRGRELARQETSEALRTEVEAQLASVIGAWYLRRAEPDKALVVLERGLDCSVAADEHAARSDLLRGLGRALSQMGRHDAAQRYLIRAATASTRADDVAGQARTHAAMAMLHLARADADSALGEAMGGMALGGAVEDPALAAVLTLCFVRVELASGSVESAEAELDNAARLAARSGAPLLELEAQLLAAEVATRRGRPTLARPAVDGVLARAETLGEIELVGRARLLLADILAQRGRHEEALTVLLDVLHHLDPARRELRGRAVEAVRRLGASVDDAAKADAG